MVIQVEQLVFDQFHQVREEGRFNMFAFNSVQVAASDLDLYALVIWMEMHKKEWASVIFDGLEVISNRKGTDDGRD